MSEQRSRSRLEELLSKRNTANGASGSAADATVDASTAAAPAADAATSVAIDAVTAAGRFCSVLAEADAEALSSSEARSRENREIGPTLQ